MLSTVSAFGQMGIRGASLTHSIRLQLAVFRTREEGMATARPYRGVFLTESGRELAVRVRMRHRLVVDVLLAMGVPVEAAEADAEGTEHHVSETTLKAFAQFLRSRS
jgi:DtxR family manganese transport transcriptional regulator